MENKYKSTWFAVLILLLIGAVILGGCRPQRDDFGTECLDWHVKWVCADEGCACYKKCSELAASARYYESNRDTCVRDTCDGYKQVCAHPLK